MTQTDSPSRRARGRPRDWHDKSEQNTIKSLDRAMLVFEYLSTHPGLSLSEMASAMDQSPATLYRVLITLEGRGLVEFDSTDQTWNIGAQAFVIGARFLRRTSLVERARPIMRILMEATGETANLGVQQGNSVMFVSQIETHETIRAFFPPGTVAPMHSSGIGKALLAAMDSERLDTLLINEPRPRFTDFTICNEADLKADLDATRQRGYSIDAEEKNIGMRCIAAPVFDFNGEAIAGISVSGPTARMHLDQTRHIASFVVQAALDLTTAIGGRVP